MTYPKRLIEVDLPIKRISVHARNEKDSRCGHVPRLHIYPAARPLAACRAVICASLWPDPADPQCPQSFRNDALKLIRAFAKATQSSQDLIAMCDDESWKRYSRLSGGLAVDVSNKYGQELLRTYLFDFIADFASWDASRNRVFLETADALTRSAHEATSGTATARPMVVDPFAGGGAIPLESLRCGADVFASDLNPLAVLINKVVLEYAPQNGEMLAEHLAKWCEWAQKVVNAELGCFFPSRDNLTQPMAYLWARTIISEAPTEGLPVEVPLIRSMWLQRKGTPTAIRWKRDGSGEVLTETVSVRYQNGETREVRRPLLEIFYPRTSEEVERGTAARSSATCPVTNYTTPAKSVTSQLCARTGGASDARLYCVVASSLGGDGRAYYVPSADDLNAIAEAGRVLAGNIAAHLGEVSLVPNEPLPIMSGVFNAPLYGHNTWGTLFNARQALVLTTYARLAREYTTTLAAISPKLAESVATAIGLVVDRLADLNASLCGWQLSTPNTAHVFTRWALPMMMDYGEVNPLIGGGGSPESALWRAVEAIRGIASAIHRPGTIAQADAAAHPLPDDSVDFVCTDPPYYNAVPYADLSDFFYVWLRRSVLPYHKDVLKGNATPKDAELCEMSGWDEVRYANKDKKFFESGMTRVMEEARRILQPHGIAVVVFAHKSTSGWEAMLQAIVDSGWMITASWPIDTEMESRLRAKNSAALASSVHLVCRPREDVDGKLRANEVGDWRDVLAELPKRTRDWMARLSSEGVVGADAIFACLGPALEIFSRYSKVEKASGEQVMLKEYLTHVWGAVAQEALAQIFKDADATGFEEDARLTAMWLWTLNAGASPAAPSEDSGTDGESEQDDDKTPGGGKTTGYVLEYDAARKIAQGLGAHLETMTDIVELKGDKARLLSVGERTRKLFGKDEADAPKTKPKKKDKQLKLGFAQELEAAEAQSSWGDKSVPKVGNTTLDRVHQSMILFAAGRGEALRRFLVEDGAGQDQRFWKLANALSALYPQGTDEKRWVDGVLARKKGLGL
jgi:putative DNA methylase